MGGDILENLSWELWGDGESSDGENEYLYTSAQSGLGACGREWELIHIGRGCFSRPAEKIHRAAEKNFGPERLGAVSGLQNRHRPSLRLGSFPTPECSETQ